MKNVYHVLLGLLCLFGSLLAFAQSFTRVDTMLGPWEMVREPFLTLDTNLIPTGYLLDASLVMADLQQYRGDTVPHDTMAVDRDTYQDLYITALGSSMTVAARDSLLTFRHVTASRHANDTLRLHALGLAYNKLDPEFQTDGLLTIDTVAHRIYDVPNPPRSPYITDTTFYFTIAGSQLDTLTHDFIFERQDLVGNLDATATNYYLDAGNGFQKYDFDTLYSLTFPAYGTYQLSLKLATTSGWRYAKAELILEQQQQRMMMEDQCDETIDFEGGSYCIKYGPGCEGEELFRPLIIVNGFDPTGERYLRFNRMVNEFGERFPSGHRFENRRLGQVFAEDYKYDLIFVTFDEGSASNITTAAWLRNAIESINAKKVEAGVYEDSPIIGLSMGGLVTKIAIHQMDSLQIDHGLNKFFTFDTPLRGANIPLGIQHVLAHYYYANVAGIPLRTFKEDLREKGRQLYNPAAAEMLLYQGYAEVRYSLISRLTRMHHWTTNEAHVKFQKYMDGLEISVPLYAISNGSSSSNQTFVEPGLRSQVQPGEKIMRQEIIAGVFNIHAVGYALPKTFAVEVNGITGFRSHMFHLSSLPNIDIIAGGTRGTHDTDEFGENPDKQGGGLRWFDDYHSFIPTLSSIDSPLPGEPSTVGGNVDFTYIGNEQLQSRHEGVNHDVFNHKHVSVTPGIANFLVEHLDPGPSLTSIGTQVNTLAEKFNYGTGVNALNGPVSTPTVLYGNLEVTSGGSLLVNLEERIGDITNNSNPDNNTDPFSLTLTDGPCDSPPADITLYAGSEFIVGQAPQHKATLIALPETRVTVKGGSVFEVNSGSDAFIHSDGPDNAGGLVVESGGLIHAKFGGEIIADGGTIRIKAGGQLRTSNGSRIIARNGGKIILEDGALVQLWAGSDPEGEGTVWIQEGGELVIEGEYDFTGSGYWQFSKGNTVSGDGDFIIEGDGKNFRRMKVNSGATVSLTEGQDFLINDAKIVYRADSKVSVTSGSAFEIDKVVLIGAASTAIYTDGSARSSIDNSEFLNNKQSVELNQNGPLNALYINSSLFQSATIAGVKFTGPAPDNFGRTPSINGCVFNGCKKGVEVDWFQAVNLLNSTFTSSEENQFAIYAKDCNSLLVRECTVSGYETQLSHSSLEGAVELEYVTARFSGGEYSANTVAIHDQAGSTLTFTNCAEVTANCYGIANSEIHGEFTTLALNGMSLLNNGIGIHGGSGIITSTNINSFQMPEGASCDYAATPRLISMDVGPMIDPSINLDGNHWMAVDGTTLTQAPDPSEWFCIDNFGGPGCDLYTIAADNVLPQGCGSGPCESPKTCEYYCQLYPEDPACFNGGGIGLPGFTATPNPSGGTVALSQLPEGGGILQVFDARGAMLRKINLNQGPFQTIELGDLTSGIYTLDLMNTKSGEREVVRLVINK